MEDTLKLEDLRSGMLVQDGSQVYKVSTLYLVRNDGSPRSAPGFTAQLLLPVPPRTTVRHFDALDLVRFREPSDAKVRKLDAAYGTSPTRIRS
jgi:hypothetical protein